MSTITIFNDHFSDFINDIQSVFPDDVDILTAKNALSAIKKANPKLIIKIWKTYIVKNYKEEIISGDISFFINKDYSKDISSNNSDKIIDAINRLRNPIKNMTSDNQLKTMKYIQNLTKISEMLNE